MKYTIKHACGHVSTVQIYGSAKERESREKWLSQQVCMECKRRGERLEAEAAAKEYALPDLEGSEKQREWAVRIRGEWLRRMCDAAASRYGDKAAAVKAALIEAASTRKSAAWWIDNRDRLNAALAPVYEEALRRRGITE